MTRSSSSQICCLCFVGLTWTQRMRMFEVGDGLLMVSSLSTQHIGSSQMRALISLRQMWDPKLPLKVKISMWRIMQGRHPTCEVHKRLLQNWNNTCRLRNSTLQLLKDSKDVNDIWEMSLPAILWVIWKECNNQIFKKEFNHPALICKSCICFHLEWHYHVKGASLHDSCILSELYQ